MADHVRALRVQLTKRPDGGTVLRCVRADGSATWQRQDGAHARFFAFHDLTHLAVEATLGFRRGFYGLVASRWEIADTTGKGARGRLPAEAVLVEHLVGLFDRERIGGAAALSTAEFNAQLEQLAAAGRVEMAPPFVTDAQLAAVRARIDALPSTASGRRSPPAPRWSWRSTRRIRHADAARAPASIVVYRERRPRLRRGTRWTPDPIPTWRCCMLLEQRPVSRKTPLDGKLEISAATAARLAALGAEFPLVSAGRTGRGRLEALPCTCAKGAGGGHVHHFVQSRVLTELTPGTDVRVELDADGPALRIQPAGDGSAA